MNLVIGILFAVFIVITTGSIVYLIAKSENLERRLRKLEDNDPSSDFPAAD